MCHLGIHFQDLARGLKELLEYEGNVEDDFGLTFQVIHRPMVISNNLNICMCVCDNRQRRLALFAAVKQWGIYSICEVLNAAQIWRSVIGCMPIALEINIPKIVTISILVSPLPSKYTLQTCTRAYWLCGGKIILRLWHQSPAMCFWETKIVFMVLVLKFLICSAHRLIKSWFIIARTLY